MKQTYVKECRICKQDQVFEAHPEDLGKWQDGVKIQLALPYLKTDVRELLISGTCGTCFNKLFGDE